MRIAVLGTGMVGRTLAARLAGLEHKVTMGTRDAAASLARTDTDSMGNPPLSEWLAANASVRLAAYADAAADAELIINATNGAGSLAALEAAGLDGLGDIVVLDVSNPLDFSGGMPPTLFVDNTDSLAEQLQRRFANARIVKALNTMNALLMADPRQLAGGDHSVFVSGDDLEAKRTVSGLLTEFGHTDIVDLGDISTARGPEMYLPLWLRLWAAVGSPMFNVKVVR